MNVDLVGPFGRTLSETEWLSPEKLRLYQAPLLSRLLRHAQRHSAFYYDRFAGDLESAEQIDSIWPHIPVLSRAEAVANRERIFSAVLPPEAGAVSKGQTSGSTGVMFFYRQSQLNEAASQALTERGWRWWNVDGARPSARITHDPQLEASPPHGTTVSGWHRRHPRTPHHVLSATADVETQVRWLAARRPAYLGTYGSLLKEIARHCRRTGTPLEFKLLFSFGTVVDDETRELCRLTFGAEIADTYGAMEVGHLASQCPQCGEYHVSAEANHVEILRDDGSAATEGETGRVVVTSLYNYAMPLIRYEIGDLAEVGSARARCRRGLPSLRRILGRYRNLFRFRDGTTVWPWPSRFKEYIPHRQFQVVQTDFDHIEIRYVPESSERPIDIPALTEHVRHTLRQPVEVTLRAVDSIARSAGGKYEDFVSHVAP